MCVTLCNNMKIVTSHLAVCSPRLLYCLWESHMLFVCDSPNVKKFIIFPQLVRKLHQSTYNRNSSPGQFWMTFPTCVNAVSLLYELIIHDMFLLFQIGNYREWMDIWSWGQRKQMLCVIFHTGLIIVLMFACKNTKNALRQTLQTEC